MLGFCRWPKFEVVCLGSWPKTIILGWIRRKASMTTFPFTDWIGSTTTATARSDNASKLCWVLISTPGKLDVFMNLVHAQRRTYRKEICWENNSYFIICTKSWSNLYLHLFQSFSTFSKKFVSFSLCLYFEKSAKCSIVNSRFWLLLWTKPLSILSFHRTVFSQ